MTPQNGTISVGPAKIVSPFDEIGDSGLKRYGGTVNEEFLYELQGINGVKVLREMSENDAICAAMLYALETLCRRATWRVNAASSSQEDQFWADFIEECRRDMSHTWESFVMEAFTMFRFGWAWHEKIFKIRGGDVRDPKYRSKYYDGRIGWRKIPLRGQESLFEWDLDKSGGIQGLYQIAYPKFDKRYIPIDKSLLFRTTTVKNNPEGRSLLRGAYKAWYFKKQIETFEAIGIERDLVGTPYAEIPAEYLATNATADQKTVANSFKKLVANLRNDEMASFVMPQAWNDQGNPLFKVGLLTSPGEKMIDTDPVIKRYDQRIAMTILADLILIGHVQLGSYALMDKKVSMFSRALDSFLDDMAAVLNMHAVPELVRLNGGRPKAYPYFTHSAVEEVSLRDLSDYVNKLVHSKVIAPSEELEAHMLDVARLPEKLEQIAEQGRTDQLISELEALSQNGQNGLAEISNGKPQL